MVAFSTASEIDSAQAFACLTEAPGLRRPTMPSHQTPTVLKHIIETVPAHDGLGTKRQGDIESLANVDAGEFRRGYADDGDGMGIQREHAAERRSISTEFALPEGVADHRASFAAGAIISRRKNAADQGVYSERMEKTAAGVDAVDVANLAGGSEVERCAGPCRNVTKGAMAAADQLPLRIGEIAWRRPELARAARMTVQLYAYQLLWVWHRQTTQDQRIQQLKQCGVRSYAKRKG